MLEGHTANNHDLSRIRLSVERWPDTLGMPAARAGNGAAPVSADGSFIVSGLAPGDFRVSITNLPGNSYVKSIRMGTQDVLVSGLHLMSPTSDVLEVAIYTDG